MHVVGDLDWAGGAKVGKHYAKGRRYFARLAVPSITPRQFIGGHEAIWQLA